MLSAAWTQYFEEHRITQKRNAKLAKEKFKECEAYVEDTLKKIYPDCGIVYTKCLERIQDGYFVIWIGQGSSTTHKNIKLEDCGIKPLELYDYPVQPDFY